MSWQSETPGMSQEKCCRCLHQSWGLAKTRSLLLVGLVSFKNCNRRMNPLNECESVPHWGLRKSALKVKMYHKSHDIEYVLILFL